MLSASLLLTLALADAPTPPPDSAVSDAGELQGEWEIVRFAFGTNDLTRVYEGDRWVFAGHSARFIGASGRIGSPRALLVNVAGEPSEIDVTDQDGQTEQGIYRRASDELLWARKLAGDGRPSSFNPASGVRSATLRRVKK